MRVQKFITCGGPATGGQWAEYQGPVITVADADVRYRTKSVFGGEWVILEGRPSERFEILAEVVTDG